MSQSLTGHESMRAKFLLFSIAIIIVGLTLAILPVQATQQDAAISNLPVTNGVTFNLGYAQANYNINVYLTTVGTYRLTITNIDQDLVLFSQTIYSTVLNPPPILNTLPGNIQVRVTSFGGSSATLNASIQHSTMTYPMQIPGLALLVAGAAVILTRVVKIGVTVSSPTPLR